MCGIAGAIRTDGGLFDRAGLERMVRSLAHRGPDSLVCRSYHMGRAGLGHARLAIIDLSTGDQPMSSHDGEVGLVFNGEIYNYVELRSQLEKDGISFSSKSDTEVILRLYERHGEAAINRLRGMFAFAIYDSKKEKLILARDRLGKKPLYYMERNHEILFASELKAILAYLGEAPEVDWSFLSDYLMLGYIPQPATPFRDIRKLQAGHYLVVEQGKRSLKPYWSVPDFQPSEMSLDEVRERTKNALQEAVSIRLQSDVPFGALLSGGIDSSLVTALMVQSGKLTETARTFSVGFQDQEHNELAAAAAIANHLGTSHREEVLEIDVADVLPRIVWHMDEPFADSSAIPTWYVSAMAAREVKMVVSGDGGDELFCGYDRYAKLAQILAIKKRRVLAGFIFAAGLLLPSSAAGAFGKISRLASYLIETPEKVHTRLVGIFGPEALRFLGIDNKYVFPPVLISNAWFSGGGTDLDRAMHTDIGSYLLEDVLVKVDRMSMAHSLEVRSPLLDHELLELAATIPLRFKSLGSKKGKLILRDLAAGLLPEAILMLPKRGFSSPVDEWYRSGPLRSQFQEEIQKSSEVLMRFRSGAIHDLFDAVDRGVPATGEKLFALHTLLIWHRLCVKGMSESSINLNLGKFDKKVSWVGQYNT